MSINYITTIELKHKILKNQNEKQNFLIIDVRDADFDGGAIKHAINIPSIEFKSNLDVHVERICKQTNEQTEIIFHCMMSQVRGPSCAQKFKRRAQELGWSERQVFVLQGGFSKWEIEHGKDPQLTVDYDEEMWNEQRDFI